MKSLLTKILTLLGVFLFLGAGNAHAWKVYYDNPSNWGSVNAYVYNGDGEKLGGWPGKQMTKVNGIWEVEGTGTPGHIIFNNYYNSSEQTNGKEATTFVEGATYTGNSGKDAYVTKISVLYIRGEFNNWNAQEAWKLTSTDNINFTLSNVTIPANNRFKIATNNWYNDYTYSVETAITEGTTQLYNNYQDNYKGMYASTELKNVTINYNNNTHNLTITSNKPDNTGQALDKSKITAVYMMGAYNKYYNTGNNCWEDKTRAYKLTKQKDGSYRASGVEFKYDNGNSYYKFLVVCDGQDYWFGPSDENNDVVITPNANSFSLATNGGTERDAFKSYKTTNGIYTVTFKFNSDYSAANFNLTSSSGSNVFMYGDWNNNDKNKWGNTEFWRLAQSGPNTYTGRLNVTTDAYFRFKVDNVIYGPGSSDKDAVKNGTNTTEKNSSSNAFKLPKGYYFITVTNNNGTVTFTVEETTQYPEKMYIMGHLKNLAWEIDNYVEMTKLEEGVYEATDVNFSGCWNSADKDANETHTDRIEGRSTIDENYIAFFERIPLDRESFGKNSFKWDANSNDNVTVTLTPQSDEHEMCSHQNNLTNYSSKNYMVARGVYNVRIDLKNGDAIFYKKTENNLSYDWHDYDGEMIDYQDGTFHAVEIKEHIQVGVDGNATHEVANAADFEVRYRRTRPSSVAGVKALATGDTDSEGFTLVTKDSEYYNLIGEGVEDINMIQFLQPGYYKVTASLPENHDLAEVYKVAPVTLYAVASERTVDAPLLAPQTISFDNSGEALKYPAWIRFKTSDMDFGSDQEYEVTFTPNDLTQGWYGYKSSDKYLDLDEDIYDQYEQMGNVVDGLYKPFTVTSSAWDEGDADQEGYYSYYVTVQFPCSGVYKMTVKPAENSNTQFDEKTTTVTVNPNLDLFYSDKDIAAFNINGYGFTSADLSTINYYIDKNAEASVVKNELKNSVAYKPGLYFDSSFTMTVGDAASIDEEEDTTPINTNWIEFDFTALYDANQSVTVNVTKNGASTTKTFLVTRTNDPTEVDSIEAVEEGEAVYFNLQGVKVQNPEHGIYVKVQNGKATKVVL